MTKLSIRFGFLVLVLGGGILIGLMTAPGEWYANLAKPIFNPPNWIFGPVWSVLYVLIAWICWRQFEVDKRSVAMRLWWAQLGLNFLWSPVFFVLQLPWVALLIILALLSVIIAFIRNVSASDRVATFAFLPYLAWVAFASTLNLSISILN
ncbi:TspO/MBR family protein [uncultured Ruegeria sp.]|uniref:TspO/MBR family protein n=1 Tax=uncultured Ruegeria sp. TaxID=259304 RepID=UPI00262EE3AE|nr:TspO/MBR family protein [uncultured Ruegeria sp.]